MSTTLITIDPATGAEIRTPWRSPSGRDDMERAAARMQGRRRLPIPPDAGQGCQSPRYHPGQWWRT